MKIAASRYPYPIPLIDDMRRCLTNSTSTGCKVCMAWPLKEPSATDCNAADSFHKGDCKVLGQLPNSLSLSLAHPIACLPKEMKPFFFRGPLHVSCTFGGKGGRVDREVFGLPIPKDSHVINRYLREGWPCANVADCVGSREDMKRRANTGSCCILEQAFEALIHALRTGK